jgi:hypothetical protein
MAADRALPDRLEPDSTRPRLLLAIAGVVLALLVVAFGATFWFYTAEVPARGPIVPRTFPTPRLLQDETDELHRVEAEQRARLNGYRWVDRTQGIVSIPIGEAMRMIAAKGADGYAPIVPPSQAGGQ